MLWPIVICVTLPYVALWHCQLVRIVLQLNVSQGSVAEPRQCGGPLSRGLLIYISSGVGQPSRISQALVAQASIILELKFPNVWDAAELVRNAYKGL